MPDPITRLNTALEGRYRIERELGEGGMATVYLADDIKHERKVALKVLKPELAAVVGAERFLAEIKTTANLQHPHILPLFDSGEADGLVFYVMPYVEGESLREQLDREHQLPVDDAVRIASDVAEALEYAHGHGVIHRDIKPANILIQAGRPVIADFGIALAVSAGGGHRLTETGLSVGTPHYMSPEQATGDQHVGTATDIYALGCVLYEMLVGEPPYTGSTPQAILGKIIQGKPASATEARRSVPANVDAAIRKSLEKVSADRFTGARAFGKALGDPGFRQGTEGTSAPGRVQGLFNPLSLGLGALTLLLGLALGRFVLAPVAEPNPLSVSRQVISVPPAAPLVPSTSYSDVAISPDGRTMIYQAAGRQLVVGALDELGTSTLRGPSAALGAIWSPDGESVAFQAGSGGPLQRVSISGGPPLTLAPLSGSLLGASWGPDDAIVFGTHGEEGLRQVSATTGQVTSLTETDGTFAHVHPDVLPNGEGILFVVSTTWRGATDDQIAVFDRITGEHRVIIESGTSPRYASSGHIVYVLGSTLMAVAFDAERLAVTGVPIPVLEGINVKFNGTASFSLSASGSLVYVSGTEPFGAPRIAVWVDRDGGEEPLPLPPQQYFYPRLSPDAARLAVSVVRGDPAGLQVWVFDVASAAPVRFTAQGTNHVPVWVSDSLLAFTSEEPNGRARLHSVMADGNAEPQPLAVARDEISSDWPTSITPDGRDLIFTRLRSGDRAILRWPLVGDALPEPLLQGALSMGGAQVSPDGRWLAYHSPQTGQLEVFVQPYPRGAAVRAPIEGGRSHAWSPDGSELIYRLDDRMMAVPFTADGNTPRFGQPTELFPGSYMMALPGAPRMYDVAPDGRLLMLKFVTPSGHPDDLGPRVVLVQNWFDELERLVPN